MRRRSRAGGTPAKSQRRKAARLKRRNAPKTTRQRGVSIAGQETVVARLTCERDEALLRETANSEILRLISESPGDLELVFRTILEYATRICNAKFGTLVRFDGQRFHPAAQFNTPTAFLEEQTRRGPFEARPGSPVDQVMRTRKVFHSADNAADPVPALATKFGGARSLLAVPMLKDDRLLGIIVIYRQEVRPFTDEQIELVQSFAAQAVIAIEDARLLRELRQSLEQQTGTSEVLRVISSSPGELEPVFQAVLDSATRLCEANFGILYRYEAGAFHAIALRGAPPAFAEFQQRAPIHPPPASGLDRIVSTRQPVHIIDTMAERRYMDGDPYVVTAVKLSGSRTLIFVPMLKDEDLIGAITIYRREVRPFTDKQIELLQNFAAQGVIAIENARLLNELRQRTKDLSESLQQQTATSEILDVISNSPTDSQPAFNAIVRSGLRLFPDAAIMIGLLDGDFVRNAAIADADPAGAEALRARMPIPLSREFITSTAILDRREVDLPDVRKAPVELAAGARNFLATGYRAMTVVPMMRGEAAIGTVNVVRRRPGPLSDKQRELLRIFANQAVIAIENTRLFNELRQRTTDLAESLEQQTATSEVLKVISSSPDELEPVFHTVLKNAVKLCEAKFGTLFIFDGICFHVGANFNVPAPLADYQVKTRAFVPPPGLPLARLVETKKVAHMLDDPEGHSPATKLGGARTHIAVPMLKEAKIAGAIYIYRQEVKPFADKQIALVENFAAQTVIAIENTRLLNELRQRTDDLSKALEQQTATSEVLRVISSSPGELEPVFQAMLENAVRICEAKFGTLFRYDGELFQKVASVGTPAALVEFQSERGPFKPETSTRLGRLLRTKAVYHTADELNEPEPGPPAKFGGARSVLGVPMLKDEEFVGAIVIYRQEVRRSLISRSRWSQILPPKPSSPSRTRGCLMSCGNRWNSKQRHPKFLK
jgi:GAF domain-containing protein